MQDLALSKQRLYHSGAQLHQSLVILCILQALKMCIYSNDAKQVAMGTGPLAQQVLEHLLN